VDQSLATAPSAAGPTASGAPRAHNPRATLHRYFTGRALQLELARLEPSAQPVAAADVAALGGGIRAFSVARSSRLGNNTAVLTGKATAWGGWARCRGTAP
jgi:hypothetical protein